MASEFCFSHDCITAISTFCAVLMREASDRTRVADALDGASADISTACAWCGIIICTNRTSAAVGAAAWRGPASRVALGSPGRPGTSTDLDGAASGSSSLPQPARAVAATTAATPTTRIRCRMEPPVSSQPDRIRSAGCRKGPDLGEKLTYSLRSTHRPQNTP